MLFLYNLGIRLYVFAIRIASLFNSKAKLWIDGRKNSFENLKSDFQDNPKVLWFHVSSLGEFEQGRPVIEAVKKKYPDYKILLTFFSPSGYEIRKNYSGADFIYYLPVDTKQNAKQFLEIVNPTIAFFVKYEYWFHYLKQLNNKKIPTYIFSAIFRENQLFFKPQGKWYRKMLSFFKVLYVQNDRSKELLKTIGIQNVVIAGDTRFDRVFDISQQKKDLPLIEKFAQNSKVIVAGSTWEKDEELISDYIEAHKEIKWIIAPHEIHESHIEKIEKLLKNKCLRYSGATQDNILSVNVLIIDSIGLLSSLFKFGHVAYIGGGFGSGIHNTLEAATYGIPVLFGPNYKNFQEACDLIEKNAGFSINNSSEFISALNSLFTDEILRNEAGNAAINYVNSMRGGTKIILAELAP
ncbi:MAG: 3-deoxy-D-manno-octulosonic acid transferase [Salinivirgaceae bacterium]|nr:3-deoxy-D-manno-octulosonic acid transferase [Salinivirgaceae bacterium]